MRGVRLALWVSVMGMALAVGASASFADTVELNDGTVHKGKVVADSKDVVGFKTEAGKLLMIKKADIKELKKGPVTITEPREKKEEVTPEEPKGKEGPQPSPEKKPEKPAKITVDVLKARKVPFDFVETPLKDVLEHLTKVSAIPISLDEKLPAEDRRVTLKATEQDLATSLRWICKLVALQYLVTPDRVIVTSAERAIQFQEKVRRVYNVAKLVSNMNPDVLVPNIQGSVPGPWGKEYGTSMTLRGNTLVVVHTEEVQEKVKDAITMFTNTIERQKGKGR